MTNLNRLNIEIEILRGRLHTMVERKRGLLLDEEVRLLSERLDCLIVEHMRCKMVKSD